MIGVAKTDTIDVLGSALTANAPVAADGADFAAMIAAAGQGLGDNEGVTPKAIDPAIPQPSIKDDATAAAPAGEALFENLNLSKPEFLSNTVTVPGGAEPKSRPISSAGADAPDCHPEVAEEHQADPSESPKSSQIDTILPARTDLSIATPVLEMAVFASITEPKQVASKPEKSKSVGTAPVELRAARMTAQMPIALEVRRPVADQKAEQPDLVATLPIEQRTPAQPLPVIDKAAMTAPDRVPVFAAAISDAAVDVLTLTKDTDMRFNVRPETLGRVAVTIERGEAGLGLRMGVESPAAVQAVRQAEPMLNDVRGNSPFVQVSIDLNSPDTRGRPSRGPIGTRRVRQNDQEIMLQPAPVIAGRYA